MTRNTWRKARKSPLRPFFCVLSHLPLPNKVQKYNFFPTYESF